MDLNLLTKIIIGKQGRKPTEMKQWYKSNSKNPGMFSTLHKNIIFLKKEA